MPRTDPTGTTQLPPAQQSALMVHEAPQPAQTALAQRRVPVASGTHGAPLQQSNEEAHVSLASLHAVSPLQRGIPLLSSMQSEHLSPCFSPMQFDAWCHTAGTP